MVDLSSPLPVRTPTSDVWVKILLSRFRKPVLITLTQQIVIISRYTDDIIAAKTTRLEFDRLILPPLKGRNLCNNWHPMLDQDQQEIQDHNQLKLGLVQWKSCCNWR